jgi:sucrose phosphorylase
VKPFRHKDYICEDTFLNLPIKESGRKPEVPPLQEKKIRKLISEIWENEDTGEIYKAIEYLMTEAIRRKTQKIFEREKGYNEKNLWSESELYLICFADHIKERNGQASGNRSNLQILADTIRKYFPKEVFPGLNIHLLPFYPSPGVDRGFDAIDPFEVQRTMGSWEDIESFADDYDLAFDFVLNHLSIENKWYQEFLKGSEIYKDFFITFDEDNPKDMKLLDDIRRNYQKLIYRPRAHDPFVKVQKADGTYTYTFMHFSFVQPDVNYKNPLLFMKMAETLLYFVLRGARTLRLDAIGYIWKEWGTSCMHHPKAHKLVELFRAISDLFSPSTILLAESMEPPADAQRYLTEGEIKKGHLAYNFLPCGLIPYSFITENAKKFQNALKYFKTNDPSATQAIVCGKTHDGSSVNACREPKSVKGEAVLTENEINMLADYYTKNGLAEIKLRSKLTYNDRYFVVSDYPAKFREMYNCDFRCANFKTSLDEKGNQIKIVYEIVSTYASLFNGNPEKIVSALATALPLKGIPFIYLTAVFAALNDYDYFMKTGNPRQLNEGRLLIEEIERDLENPKSLTCQVLNRMLQLFKLRTTHKAFHPKALMKGIAVGNDAILAILRESQDNKEKILSLQNVSSQSQKVNLDLKINGFINVIKFKDLISGKRYSEEKGKLILELKPYQAVWLLVC